MMCSSQGVQHTDEAATKGGGGKGWTPTAQYVPQRILDTACKDVVFTGGAASTLGSVFTGGGFHKTRVVVSA